MHMNCIKCGLLVNNSSHVTSTVAKALHVSLDSDQLCVCLRTGRMTKGGMDSADAHELELKPSS